MFTAIKDKIKVVEQIGFKAVDFWQYKIVIIVAHVIVNLQARARFTEDIHKGNKKAQGNLTQIWTQKMSAK